MYARQILKMQPMLVLVLAVGFAASTAWCPQAVAQLSTKFTNAAQNARVKNIVLVHGAWADGSSFETVIPLLQEEGFNIVSVQIPLTSFADDVATVQRALDLVHSPV